MRRGEINYVRLKKTGEETVLFKEEDDTLFQDQYADYKRENYYTISEFDFIEKREPLDIKFTLKETVKYYEFCKEHNHSMKNNPIEIIINGTGIGWCKKVRCNCCDIEKDITDVDVW